MTTYTVDIETKEPQYSRSLTALKWPSVAGHLQSAEEDCVRINVIRETDGLVILRYDMDGFDL